MTATTFFSTCSYCNRTAQWIGRDSDGDLYCTTHRTKAAVPPVMLEWCLVQTTRGDICDAVLDAHGACWKAAHHK